MSASSDLEVKLVQVLKAAKVFSLDHVEALSLVKKALKLSQSGQYDKAAATYGALATVAQENLDIPLRTAQCYQKAKCPADAARWFLIAAERYARQNYPTQAIAALRLYHAIRPDDQDGPKRIYKLCRERGEERETMLQFLSPKDRAGRKLHTSDLFAVFDDPVFETLLERMAYRSLADREVLVRMGDTATSLFFVIRGGVDGYLTLHNRMTHLGTVSEGGICGETAFFTGGRRTEQMAARGETELLELPYSVLESLKEGSPALNHHLEALYRSRMLVKQLSLTALFEALPAETRQQLAAQMKPVKIAAGQTLFQEGAPLLDLYLVRKGQMSVNIKHQDSEQLLKTVETGAVVGEMAIAAGGRRTATVRANTDCILMKLDGSDYSQLYNGSPQLQELLKKRKLIHIAETRDMLKGVKKTEGDDTCELLLKDIWQADS